MLWTATVTVATLILMQPVFGDLADRLIPAKVVEWTASVHSRERIDIWKSFGAVIEHRLWIGTGLGTSARLDQDPVAQSIAPNLTTLLAVGHPHNNFLQIWVELGLAGVLILLALWASIALRLSRLQPRLLPERLAFLTSTASIALVSHGAWQGWWIAAIGLGCVLLRSSDARAREERE